MKDEKSDEFWKLSINNKANLQFSRSIGGAGVPGIGVNLLHELIYIFIFSYFILNENYLIIWVIDR